MESTRIGLIRYPRHPSQSLSGPGSFPHDRPHSSGPDALSFSVSDNGIGIAPDDLTRIFAQGFTTKEHGHGFGLHGGALAAREMGGALSVHRDGPAKGATFTLMLKSADAGDPVGFSS